MPLNLAICAAVVPDGWDVEIVDENVTDIPARPRRSRHRRGRHRRDDHARPAGPTRWPTPTAAWASGDPGRHPPVGPAGGGAGPRRHRLPGRCRGHAATRTGRPGGRNCAQHLYDWTEHPDAPIATPRKDLLDPQRLPGLQPDPDDPRLPARLHVLHHAGDLRAAVPPAADRGHRRGGARRQGGFRHDGLHLQRRQRRRQPPPGRWSFSRPCGRWRSAGPASATS